MLSAAAGMYGISEDKSSADNAKFPQHRTFMFPAAAGMYSVSADKSSADTAKFPLELHRMLHDIATGDERRGLANIVRWQQDGKSFVIFDR